MNARTAYAVIGLFIFATAVSAQETFKLYAGPAPGTEDWTYEVGEMEYFSKIFNTEVVTNVSQPTLTAYLPNADKANGTAVIIAPGGGFHALSINSEGIDVAKWLNERGVTAFVLRYRLFPTGEDGVKDLMSKSADQERVRADMAAIAPFSGADGLEAIRYVRANAEQFAVNPKRIGFMGFSAGGAVTAHVAFFGHDETRADFLAPIYAAITMVEDEPTPKNAAPMFIVAASNDALGLAPDSVALYTKWLEAKKPVELHMYAKGGHGFGMRKQDLPTDHWIDRFGEWLEMQGLMGD